MTSDEEFLGFRKIPREGKEESIHEEKAWPWRVREIQREWKKKKEKKEEP